MYYWIDQDDQIVGIADTDTIGVPASYQVLPGPGDNVHAVYYDGTAIQLKPEQPSEAAYWDSTTNTWQEPPPPPPPPVVPNWGGLADGLVADIAILSILSANPLFPALVGRLQTLRNGAPTGDPEPLIALWNHQSYSFSEEQIDSLNQLAIDNDIPLVVSEDGTMAATISP